jgi:UDP-glucuronate decarboxylase
VNTVLIVGCSGEIGSRLTSSLLSKNFRVYGIRNSRKCHNSHPMHKCKELDLLDFELNLRDIRPNVLIHTAWITTPGTFWNSELNRRWVDVSKQLIEEFVSHGGEYLVVTGSCAEYSWESGKTLDEHSIEDPNTLYGLGRIELLNWIRSRNLPFLWTRTFFQFGMREAPGRLIPSLIDAFAKNERYSIQNKDHIRDFVFVEDVVQIIDQLICLRANGVVNIGRGVGWTIEEVGLLVMNTMGKYGLIDYSDGTATHSQVVSNTSKLKSLIGDYKWVPMEEAVSRSIDARLEKNKT